MTYPKPTYLLLIAAILVAVFSISTAADEPFLTERQALNKLALTVRGDTTAEAFLQTSGGGGTGGTVEVTNWPMYQLVLPAGTFPVYIDPALITTALPVYDINRTEAVADHSTHEFLWQILQQLAHDSTEVRVVTPTQVYYGTTPEVLIGNVIHSIIDSMPSLSLSGTSAVEIDDEDPVRMKLVDRQVEIANWLSSFPVTGVFWPETQPVSGTVGISGTVPVRVDDALPVKVEVVGGGGGDVNVTNESLVTEPKAGKTWPVSLSEPLAVVNSGTQPVALTDGANVNVINDVAVHGSVSVNDTVAVNIDDEEPVRTQAVGETPVTPAGTFPVILDPAFLPIPVQMMNETQAVTPAGTFPVAIDAANPVPVYAVATLPVVVTNSEPIRQRWNEIIKPFEVNGTAVAKTLTNEPVKVDVTNLSNTYEVTIARGGDTADATCWILRPGQTATFEDGDKQFSFYAESSATPARVQVYAVYEQTIE